MWLIVRANSAIRSTVKNVLLSVALLAMPVLSLAQNVVLIYDENSAYQTTFANLLGKKLSINSDLHLTKVTANALSMPALIKQQPDLIVNLDNSMTRKITASNTQITTFHTLTTLSHSRKFAPCLPNCTNSLSRHRFFVLDQPPRRQLNLIRLINPAFKNIGIIVTEQSETHLQALKKVANDSQLTINEFITSSTNVRYQIADVSKSSDIILAIADTKIYNAASLPQILLTSYRYGTPILGFSKGFIKAGAIAGTVSSLEQLTSHLAESILDFNNPHSLNTNNVIYPKYFDVITNRNVAKSLNLHFSSDNELKQQLMNYESTQ